MTNGVDIYRIFDSMNWMENMKLPVEEALKTGKIVGGSHLLHRRYFKSKGNEIYDRLLL